MVSRGAPSHGHPIMQPRAPLFCARSYQRDWNGIGAGTGAAQVYVESILALQGKGPEGTELPLAIMTSQDTHARTQALLQEHNNFGMREGQITLIKQEKVL